MRNAARPFVAALAIASAVVVSGAACHRAPDPSQTVNRALTDANLDQVKVDWDRDAHIAHLTGTVATPTDRQRAQDVASAAVGTSGRVLNEVTIRGVNDKSAGALDDDIKDMLKQTIRAEPSLKDRDIDFEVHNGVVTIKGEVRSAAEKSRLTELVREAPGVKDMANAVEIKPKS
jgi:osmotically-inducible protein OsmY